MEVDKSLTTCLKSRSYFRLRSFFVYRFVKIQYIISCMLYVITIVQVLLEQNYSWSYNYRNCSHYTSQSHWACVDCSHRLRTRKCINAAIDRRMGSTNCNCRKHNIVIPAGSHCNYVGTTTAIIIVFCFYFHQIDNFDFLLRLSTPAVLKILDRHWFLSEMRNVPIYNRYIKMLTLFSSRNNRTRCIIYIVSSTHFW